MTALKWVVSECFHCLTTAQAKGLDTINPFPFIFCTLLLHIYLFFGMKGAVFMHVLVWIHPKMSIKSTINCIMTLYRFRMVPVSLTSCSYFLISFLIWKPKCYLSLVVLALCVFIYNVHIHIAVYNRLVLKLLFCKTYLFQHLKEKSVK